MQNDMVLMTIVTSSTTSEVLVQKTEYGRFKGELMPGCGPLWVEISGRLNDIDGNNVQLVFRSEEINSISFREINQL